MGVGVFAHRGQRSMPRAFLMTLHFALRQGFLLNLEIIGWASLVWQQVPGSCLYPPVSVLPNPLLHPDFSWVMEFYHFYDCMTGILATEPSLQSLNCNWLMFIFFPSVRWSWGCKHYVLRQDMGMLGCRQTGLVFSVYNYMVPVSVSYLPSSLSRLPTGLSCPCV